MTDFGSLDRVVHPDHYNVGRIEVWDAIVAWKLDFLLGNVIKYVARAGHKENRVEDLRKAEQYIEKAIEVAEKGEDLD